MEQPVSPQQTAHPATAPVPFWRDVRVLSIIGQFVFLLIVVALVGAIVLNVVVSMERLGMPPIGYTFMQSEASFEISQTLLPYSPTDSYWRAYQVGLMNTVAVALSGIALASIVGVVLGVAQLSSNWLVARVSRALVATFRNIPLLLQLFFWYFAVFQALPAVRNAVELIPGHLFVSNRGVAVTGPAFAGTAGLWLGIILVSLLVAGGVWIWLVQLQERTGKPNPRLAITIALVVLSAVAGYLWLTPRPFEITTPVLERFNFAGGFQISPEFTALLLGLTIYTGVFIAENVRAGIQGVPKGQKEAARALGLSPGQSMRLIILPQALRIMIPPTTNQYLNLVKNSSLAIAIGYADLFQVTRTMLNQTGQVIPLTLLLMATYLTISLFTSLVMNIYNRSVRLVER